METLILKDFIDYKYISGLELSPDGKKAAFVVTKADLRTNGYLSDIWLMDMDTKKCSQLTSGGKEKSLIWLNNDTVIFPSMRDSSLSKRIEEGEAWTVYYAIDINGGEALEYMRIPATVTGIQVIDENNFAVTATYKNYGINLNLTPLDERAEAVAAIKEEKDYEVVDEIPFIGNGKGFTNKMRNRLYVYNRTEGLLNAVTDSCMNTEFYVYNGGKILYIAKNYTDKLSRMDGLYEYDIDSNSVRVVIEDSQYHLVYANYVKGKIICKMTDTKEYGLYSNTDFYVLDDGKMTLLCKDDMGYTSSVGSDCRFMAGKNAKLEDDRLYYLATGGQCSYINVLTPEGRLESITESTGSVDCLDVSHGKIVFVGMRGLRLQEIYEIENGKEIRLTSFNEDVYDNKTLSHPEHLSIVNDGVTIDGYVLKPVNYDEGKKYPAILDIHGGPKTVFGEIFYHEMQVWANMGYFVFFCNPRGGDGKGSEFADIRGKYGTIDYDDLMKFTDKVLEEYPQIDAGRVGVTGGSYGGFMTNWIIGHTDRFKCAAAQRSISNWFTEFGTTDIGYYFTVDQTASSPWQNPEKFWWHSPLKYAENVKTPTLFIHSQEDYRCWLAEGLQMFTALKYHGVESRLVMFKGENHELSRGGKPKHRIRRLEEMTGWFEKYLKEN